MKAQGPDGSPAAPATASPVLQTSRFGKDVLRLVSGTALAQLITVAASPLLTRLFDPQAFGLYFLMGSLTGIISVVGCLRYEDSILLPTTDEGAANQLTVCLLISFLVSIVSLAAVRFGGHLIVRVLNAPPALGELLWLTPPMVLVSSVALALNYWVTRKRRFAELSVARVSASATSTGIQLTGGYGGHKTALLLVTSSLIGNVANTTILGGQTVRRDGQLLRKAVRPAAVWEGMIRYRKFPLFGTASTLINNVSWELPSLLLQHYFSAAVVGFYALGNALLRLPMGIIGGAISQVFFQRAAEARRSGALRQVVESSLQRLAALSLCPLVVVTVLGKELFVFVFGSRWSEAGVYAQILAPWIFVWFISSPLSSVFSILERQEFGLKFNPVVLATRFLSLAIGGWLHSARLALLLFSAGGVAVYGYYTFAILRAAGLTIRRTARDLAGNLTLVLPVAAVLLIVKFLKAPGWLAVGSAAVCMLYYGWQLTRRDPAIIGFLAGAFSGRVRPRGRD